MMFKRGFKTWCEESAVSIRLKQGLPTSAPLHGTDLAKELNAEVLSPSDLPGMPEDCVERLLGEHAGSWSAFTIPVDPRPLIIYNPMHSAARQNSDLMHELSHILLGHEPGMVFIDPHTSLALRVHDKNQEEEASWLSGCLLLPREALLEIKRRRLSDELVCSEYMVSQQMLRYRMNTSGVNLQHRRTQSWQR